MKSSLRVQGVEILVEGVIPASEEFSKKVLSEMFKTPSLFDVSIEPKEIFGKENSDTLTAGIITGLVEGELPVSVNIFHKGPSQEESFTSLFLSVPGFIVFRK